MESLTTIKNNHDFSNTFTTEYDEDVTAKTIITPESGKRIRVTGVTISTEGATSAGQYIRAYFATSADTIAKVFCTNGVQNTSVTPIVIEGAIDEPVKITSTLGVGKNFYFSINYKNVA
ncbi:MAG: hypothetical protein WC479_08350 [Candidatus Izemoplasmatales bacterium]|jgi:hypothetical protein